MRGRKGQHKDALAAIRKAGFVRVRVNGEVFDLEHVPELAPRKTTRLEAVVDRLADLPGLESRVTESIDLAVRHGEGVVVVSFTLCGRAWPRLAAARGVVQHRVGLPALQARASRIFNCRCSASTVPMKRVPSAKAPLGANVEFDPDLVLPDAESCRWRLVQSPLGRPAPARSGPQASSGVGRLGRSGGHPTPSGRWRTWKPQAAGATPSGAREAAFPGPADDARGRVRHPPHRAEPSPANGWKPFAAWCLARRAAVPRLRPEAPILHAGRQGDPPYDGAAGQRPGAEYFVSLQFATVLTSRSALRW